MPAYTCVSELIFEGPRDQSAQRTSFTRPQWSGARSASCHEAITRLVSDGRRVTGPRGKFPPNKDELRHYQNKPSCATTKFSRLARLYSHTRAAGITERQTVFEGREAQKSQTPSKRGPSLHLRSILMKSGGDISDGVQCFENNLGETLVQSSRLASALT